MMTSHYPEGSSSDSTCHIRQTVSDYRVEIKHLNPDLMESMLGGLQLFKLRISKISIKPGCIGSKI